MSESRMGIGQHRSGDAGATNNGQKQIRGTAGDVGQIGGGEQNQGVVPGSEADSMVNTTCGAEESEFYSRNVRRK
jgi:hypothetical protein